MSKVLVFVVLICLLLAFILGAVLFSRPGDDHTWRDEQLDRVAVESAWQWARLKLYAGYLLAGLTIALVTGAGMALVKWLHRRAITIDPTSAVVTRAGPLGVFGPLIIYNLGNMLHAAAVVTGKGADVQVLQIAAPAASPEQMQATTQAQAVQFVKAAVQSGQRVDVPAAFAQLPPPRINVLPPLLSPDGGGLVDPLLLQAVETDWHEVQEE